MRHFPTNSAVALLTATILCALAGPASAHQSSFTYGRLAVDRTHTQVTYEVELKSTDLYEAIELDRDRDATDDEIRASAGKLGKYVGDRVSFDLPGDNCKRTELPIEIIDRGDRYAKLTWSFRCSEPIEHIGLDYGLFYDLDEAHIGLLQVDGTTIQLKYPDDTRFDYTVGEPPPQNLLAFVWSGVEHIIYGLDHILFLFALLLMAVVARRPTQGLKVRSTKEALRYTALIVTAFTVAHSITLIGAALDWFSLPGRLVESVIAASIVYVAVENVLRPDPPRRYLVTFVFGLIHGLGFAAMLRPLLPPEEVVLPLLVFNVGVELGQLALVVLFLPLLTLLARSIGAASYRRYVLPGGAVLLGALGMIWLIERAFEVSLLGL